MSGAPASTEPAVVRLRLRFLPPREPRRRFGRGVVLSPVSGHLSDRHGPTRIMLTAAALLLVLIYPAFLYLIAHPSFGTLITWQILFGVLVSGYVAATP